MPYYLNSPFQPIPQLMPGGSKHLFGSYNASQSSPTMQITAVTATTTSVTLNVNLVAGPIPVVGTTISVIQTQTTGGQANVQRAPVTAVSINSLTGVGTITYSGTFVTQAQTPDAGTAVADIPELGETIANGYSIPLAVTMQTNVSGQQRTYATEVTFPVMPTAVTVNLQYAIHNTNADYANVPNVPNAATVSGGAQTTSILTQIPSLECRYLRFAITGLSGTGTIIAKVMG